MIDEKELIAAYQVHTGIFDTKRAERSWIYEGKPDYTGVYWKKYEEVRDEILPLLSENNDVDVEQLVFYILSLMNVKKD